MTRLRALVSHKGTRHFPLTPSHTLSHPHQPRPSPPLNPFPPVPDPTSHPSRLALLLSPHPVKLLNKQVSSLQHKVLTEAANDSEQDRTSRTSHAFTHTFTRSLTHALTHLLPHSRKRAHTHTHTHTHTQAHAQTHKHTHTHTHRCAPGVDLAGVWPVHAHLRRDAQPWLGGGGGRESG